MSHVGGHLQSAVQCRLTAQLPSSLFSRVRMNAFDKSKTQNGDSDLQDGHAGNTKMAFLISIETPDESNEKNVKNVVASWAKGAAVEAGAEGVGASANVVLDLVVLWLGQSCAPLVSSLPLASF
jgi:hypothetical protein